MSNQAILLIKTNTTLDKNVFKECIRLLLLAVHLDPSLKDAYYYIGYLNECGYGTPLNPFLAYKYYKKAYKLGHLKSTTKYALVILNGLDNVVERNEDKAIELLQEAAAMEEPEAMNYLALIYERGSRKIPQNFEKCISLLKRAQEKGSQSASINLAIIHKSTLDEGKLNQNMYMENLMETAKKGNILAKTMIAKELSNTRYINNDEKELIEFDNF
jgi:TPR repeat protein